MRAKADLDVMDFECFKSELLTPENYMTEAKELYDVGYPADECPPYMVIYGTLKGICEDQQEIIENNLDVEVLSSSLRALPRLNELDITFCQSLDAEEWVDSYLALDMTAKEKSNQHHIQTVTRALNSARGGMLSLKTLCLSSLELPYYLSWERPNLSELSNSLKCLLDYCTILRVTESSAPLELLSDTVLNISQLDLGYVCIPYTAWRGFLEANRQSIQSIGFYDTTLIGMSRADSQLYKLSPELLPTMLRGFQFKVSESTDCCEIPSWETGWRVQLSLPRLPAKRKIADVS